MRDILVPASAQHRYGGGIEGGTYVFPDPEHTTVVLTYSKATDYLASTVIDRSGLLAPPSFEDPSEPSQALAPRIYAKTGVQLIFPDDGGTEVL